MRILAGCLTVVCASSIPLTLRAQANPEQPRFNVLTVFRESVKAGKGPAHDTHEEAWARALIAAKSPTSYLAMTAMSGAPENWYVSAYPTWADYEKSNKAGEAPALAAISKQYGSGEVEYLNDARGMVLTFREDLSYGGPADLPASRYFTVTRVSVRPGHVSEFEESRKLVKAAHESAHLTDRFSVWQAAAGAPAGTFFVFIARKSLGEIDQAPTIHGPVYQAALGGAEGQKKLDGLAASAIISSETNHFAFLPQQSMVPAEWITADSYWKPKPAPRKTP